MNISGRSTVYTFDQEPPENLRRSTPVSSDSSCCLGKALSSLQEGFFWVVEKIVNFVKSIFFCCGASSEKEEYTIKELFPNTEVLKTDNTKDCTQHAFLSDTHRLFFNVSDTDPTHGFISFEMKDRKLEVIFQVEKKTGDDLVNVHMNVYKDKDEDPCMQETFQDLVLHDSRN